MAWIVLKFAIKTLGKCANFPDSDYVARTIIIVANVSGVLKLVLAVLGQYLKMGLVAMLMVSVRNVILVHG
jgi:hypothetical protein